MSKKEWLETFAELIGAMIWGASACLGFFLMAALLQLWLG